MESVLDNWKAHRYALTAATQNYIIASAELRKFCTPGSHPLQPRPEVEFARLAIDVELAGLALEEDGLHRARMSLAATRNSSAVLSPAQVLPWELLERIFLTLHHITDDGQNCVTPPSAHSLCGVSSYWRRVAIETPALWTCITVITHSSTQDYPILMLNRSKRLPVDIYIYHWDPRESRTGLASQAQISTFLIWARCRIRTLEIKSLANPAEVIERVLHIYLNLGVADVANRLQLYDSGNFHNQLSPERAVKLPSTRYALDLLRSLTVLDLNFVVFPWSSPVYHGLVDLRLYFTQENNVQVTVFQMMAILTASPKLRSLKLHGIIVTSSDEWAGPIVRLLDMEMLCLASMSNESLARLLPRISLAGGLAELDISLEIRNPPEIIHVLEDFLHDTNTKTLICSEPCGYPSGSGWGLLLSASILSLQNLVLLYPGLFKIREEDIAVTEGVLRCDIYKLTQSATLFSRCLPHLFLVSGKFFLELLRIIVPGYSVRNLHLEAAGSCRDDPRSGDCCHRLNLVKASLRREFPNLACTLEHGNFASGWACRMH
ncbi:hypothetical protein FRC12_022868 [Ceratobasidium sp. 428]|nr:hypothetical protein FRC12_022868 [Ceratobasidium sp. 428]